MYNQNFNTVGKNYHFNYTIRNGMNDYKQLNTNNKIIEGFKGDSFANSLPVNKTNNSHNNPTQNNMNLNSFINSELNQNKNPGKNISISNVNKFLTNVNLNSSMMNQQERVINFGQDPSENSFKRNLRKVGGFNPIQTSSYNIITGIPYSSQNNGFNNLNIMGRNKSVEPTPHSFLISKNLVSTSGYNFVTNGGKPFATPRFDKNLNSINTELNKTNSNDAVTINKDHSPTPEPLINKSNDNKSNSTMKSGLVNNDPSHILNNDSFSKTNLKSFTEQIKKEKQENGILNAPDKSVFNPVINNKTFSFTKRIDETSYHIKDCFSIKEYAFKEEPNTANRLQMEDMSRGIDRFAGDDNKGLFMILDGHGGYEVAAFAKNRIPEIFEKKLSSLNDNHNQNNIIENILINLFHEVDEEIKLSEDEHIGSTATLLFITREKDGSNNTNNWKKVAYCANVGDSRCVLINSFGAKRMSKDHKVSDPIESKRITSCGGVIFAGRVYGQLILSRALGDFSLKKHGVIATPYVSKYYISEKDRYIVVASDGVWDVISDEELYRLSQTVSNSDEFVKKIISNSLMRGTQDNISCFVIKLN